MSDDTRLSSESLKERLLAVVAADASKTDFGARTALAEVMSALEHDPQGLESVAFDVLGRLSVLDCAALGKVAEAMMEKNPSLFESSVFRTAQACPCLYCKFVLVRAVFRRFPGRYRPYMLTVGRDLLHSEATPRVSLAVTWLIWKFGAELVPDLLAYMNDGVSVEDRCLVLAEAVRCLGAGALPIVTAAASSHVPELSERGREFLRRLDADSVH